MQIRPREILNYTMPNGRSPYRQWYTRIKDEKAQIAISNRITRLRTGNFGDFKRLGTNLYELRIHYGPGYRQSAKLLERFLGTNEGIIIMRIDIKLQQCTTRFKDYLLKDLAQPEFAKGYLETALQDFDEGGNIETLLLSMKDVAEAQGGVERLVAWTNLSPQALTYLLNSEHPLQLDKVLDILSRLKDSHSNHTVVDKGSTSMEEHN